MTQIEVYGINTSLAAEPIGQGGQLPTHFLVLVGKPYLLPYHFLGLLAKKIKQYFWCSHIKAMDTFQLVTLKMHVAYCSLIWSMHDM